MEQPNNEVKKYLLKFATNALENCELFTKVFGKGYAKSRLPLNLSNVYTPNYKDDDARTI